MKPEFDILDRRGFLGRLAAGGALLGLAASSRADDPPAKDANPFAYDVARFAKTDPKLITYEEAGRWDTRLPSPKRITAGPDGQLYVCAENGVQAFRRAGQTALKINLAEQARAAAVDEDGTIYVALRDHLEVFSAAGVRRAAWDSIGKTSWLTGVALSANDVYVADSGGRAVLRYDKTGKFLYKLGGKFIVPSPFLDVAWHKDGLVRVNNPGGHRVELYTPAGELETSFGQPGFGIQHFCGCCNPVAIAMLPDGRTVTGEKGIPRVKIYSAAGEFESVVAGAESFPENAHACTDLNDCVHGGLGVAVDSKGRISVLDMVTRQVLILKQKG